MRSKRALIILPLSILLLILMGITSFAEPKKKIVGTWISQSNPDYKLEFSKNGICTYFYANKEYKKCMYNISTSFDKGNDYRSLFLKMSDENGDLLDRYELKDADKANEDILVLGDVDKEEEYLYNKVY